MNSRILSLGLLSVCIAVFSSCNRSANKTTTDTKMKDSITYGHLPSDSAFEKIIDGNQTHLYTLKNKNGMVLTITNLAAVWLICWCQIGRVR